MVNGHVVVVKFNCHEEASEFIADGGLVMLMLV